MCVKFLLEYHASPNILDKDGFSSLHEATNVGSLDIVKLLLSYGADPLQIKDGKVVVRKKEKQYWTAVHVSVYRSYPDILKVLLENCSDSSKPNNSLVTPLHLAASQKNHELLAILLSHDADVGAKDIDGDPPLFPAIESRLLKNVEDLSNDQTINIGNKEGKTALHIAAICGFQEILSFFIKKGGNVSSLDTHGNSPLHYAVTKGHMECIRILLENDADPLQRNDENESPFVLSSGEILTYLRTYVEQKKENLRALPVEKTERSTRASPSRLKSRASKQSVVSSPSRSRGAAGGSSSRLSYSNQNTPSKTNKNRTTNSAYLSPSPQMRSQRLLMQKEFQPTTCHEYQKRIEEAVDKTGAEIKAEIDKLRQLVEDLKNDYEEEENRKREEAK
ncbi:hypothetical protein M9Y10_026277 [Tritrichomonas musculus]|uniref:Ankyrin repeat protein n=1 Tax=Tritrichomonas musculus TaxID=1915356 RepID=A0ABR2H781_9EUKA